MINLIHSETLKTKEEIPAEKIDAFLDTIHMPFESKEILIEKLKNAN